MRRRSIASDEPAKAQRRKTGARKIRVTSKAADPGSSSAARAETKVTRLTNELNEARQQLTATADVLNIISRSTFDLAKVLNTLLESAARLCEADKGNILRPSETDAHYYVAANYRHTPEYDELQRNLTYTPGRGGVVARVLLEGKSVQIPDVLRDPEYAYPELVRAGNFRTILGVPLLREGIPIGVLVLQRVAVRPFTEKQIKLVETFADQAVIAIENTRLFEAEQQRSRELAESLEQQTATSEVLQVISRSAFDLEAVLNTLVESAARLCEADRGTILRPTGKDASYHTAASYRHTQEFNEYSKNLTFAPGRSSVVGRVLLEGKSVQIPDVLADPEYAFLEAARLGDFRTILGAPLLREGILIGVLFLSRSAVRTFTEKQIKLVETFADQAVIAIENVRLFDDVQKRTLELTESLQQQTATSEVLKVISGSPGELEPVFKAMLGNAVRICHAKFGLLFLSEGDAFRAVALHDAPPAYAEVRRREPVTRFGPGTATDRAARTKQPVQIADVKAELAYLNDPQRFAFVDLAGGRTVVAVPMLKENELVGVIGIYRQEVRPFTDKQVELVQNFAAQAVIAIENARLLNELRQRTTDLTESLEQQTATSEVLQVISGSPGDLQPVFATMLENAARICDAKFGNIYRWDGDALHLVATHNTPPAFVEYCRRSPNVTGPAANRMVSIKTAIHVADLAAEQAYIEQREPRTVAGVELGGVRTLLAVPMLKENELIGAFTVYRQEVRPFTDKQIELVQNFAAQAVIAIENTRLLNELRELLQQQTATADVLKVISRSTFDLRTVLNTLTEFSGAALRGRQRSYLSAGWRLVADGRQLWLFARGGAVCGRKPRSREPRQRDRARRIGRQGNPYSGRAGGSRIRCVRARLSTRLRVQDVPCSAAPARRDDDRQLFAHPR